MLSHVLSLSPSFAFYLNLLLFVAIISMQVVRRGRGWPAEREHHSRDPGWPPLVLVSIPQRLQNPLIQEYGSN